MSRAKDIFDDVQGLAFGIIMTSLGVVFLKAAGLVTGQLAGLSVLVSMATPLPFGLVFFCVNLPFYLLAWRRRGAGFTLRTLISVAGISLLSPLLGDLITFHQLPVPLAGVLAGCCCSIGLIALFRHKASAGGIGILGLYLQETRGIPAGWVQMALDLLIFTGALFVIAPDKLVWSLLGALIMNLLIAWNFRLPKPQEA